MARQCHGCHTYYCSSSTHHPGYAIKHKPRKEKHGGGVGVVYKENITTSPSQPTNYTNCEHLKCSMRIDNTTNYYVIYRPSVVTSSELSFRGFIDDFST